MSAQRPPATSVVPSSAWRRIECITLIATIPAFYLAMLGSRRGIGVALYLTAFAVTAFNAWRAFEAETESARANRAQRHLHAFLAVGLLSSAALPQGATADLLILRLGTSALIVLRLGELMLPQAWQSGLPHLLGLGIGVLGLCGLGFWWLEPNAHTYGDGLWLAFTTAATVGYGDIVPSTPAAKIFAVFVVLMGFAVLSLVTASIAALWVQTEERRIEHEILRDLHREMRAIRSELADLRHAADRPVATPPDQR